MEQIQREEAQEEASIVIKKYFPNADTSKSLSRMDYENGEGAMVMSKRGRRWWPLIVNGELNKDLPRGVVDYLGNTAVGIILNLDAEVSRLSGEERQQEDTAAGGLR